MGPFALRAWFLAFKPLAYERYGLSGKKYRSEFHDEYVRLLSTQRVALAYLEDAPKVYIGFACGQNELVRSQLHWMYVKDPFRRRGFAKRMWQCVGGIGATAPRNYTFLPPTERGNPQATLVNVFENKWGMTYAPVGLVQKLEEDRDARDEDRETAVPG